MFKLFNGIKIYIENESFKTAGERLSEWLSLFYGFESSFADEDADIFIYSADLADEEYVLEVTDTCAKISANNKKGALFGVSAFLQRIEKSLSISCGIVKDKPNKPFRGLHTYLPARENIDEYKKIIDLMVFLKMNTLIIETGGAVEYKKHPEINKTWEWFCHTADFIFPGEGRSRSVQWSDIYWKDSIHTEHAGGSYLKKDEVREIVEYAKKLGLTVIPEIQALSHCYYLTLPHREIAELSDDPFPDSFCPLNEKSYELYFDVAEEIIEIFKPEFVSIGHDEIRVLGQCEKCSEKEGHQLLSYEINRLYDFYRQKGIKIMMWAEKLQHYDDFRGIGVGGDEVNMTNDYGFHYYMPATHEAIDSIPKDIFMLDWQWSLGFDSTDCFVQKGFKTAFGNFKASEFTNWDTRSKSGVIAGAEVSTWCTTDEKTFARDGIFFEMMFSSCVLWNSDFNNSKYEEYCRMVMYLADFAKSIMRNKRLPLAEQREVCKIYIPEKNDNCFSVNTSNKSHTLDEIISVCDKLYGLPIDTNLILIKKRFKAEKLMILHNTKQDMQFIPSFNFPDESPWGLGTYAVFYEDGTLQLINAIFGRSVGPCDFEIKSRHGEDCKNQFEIDGVLENGNTNAISASFSPKCAWLPSLCYECTPIFSREKTIFAYEWRNPHPEKVITKIKAINTCKDKNQTVVLYGILGINENCIAKEVKNEESI